MSSIVPVLGIGIVGALAFTAIKASAKNSKKRPYAPSTDIPDDLLAKYQQIIFFPNMTSLDAYQEVEDELRDMGYEFEADQVRRQYDALKAQGF